jgi:N-acetylglucosaminyldiphosphoundecaprenol N-acetyl-beta-D-mannosaminyltransferase
MSADPKAFSGHAFTSDPAAAGPRDSPAPATAPLVAATHTAGPAGQPCVPERDLLGIPFATLDFQQVSDLLAARPADDRFVYLATPNAHHLVLLQRGVDGFAYGLSRAWFLTCDSQVLRGMARLLFNTSLPLVTGSDLTMQLLNNVIDPADPVTVIGGSEQLSRDLAEQYGLSNIALYSPPFGFSRDEQEMQVCIDFVRDNPARFVFLACGAPQSEVLAARIVEGGGASGVGLCIGASLLFATGRLKRAPVVWQKLGLEWLYRITQDRRRLVRRLWHAQLPVLGIAANAWLSRRANRAHASRLDRPFDRLPASGNAAADGRTR